MTNEAYDYSNPRPGEYPTTGYAVPITETAPAPQPTEPSIEEHASMIRKGFDHILNKALESTELARRVGELERKLGEAEVAIATLKGALMQEEIAHGETAKALQEVQGKLAQRESVVHDLVMERDIALEERNKAQQERDEERLGRHANKELAERVEAWLMAEQEKNAVLEERCNTMQLRVNAVKEAINGLHSL